MVLCDAVCCVYINTSHTYLHFNLEVVYIMHLHMACMLSWDSLVIQYNTILFIKHLKNSH